MRRLATYVRPRSGIESFPTTWFLDRQGRIAFEEKRGNGGAGVYEEALWRIEALRAGTAPLKAAPRP